MLLKSTDPLGGFVTVDFVRREFRAGVAGVANSYRGSSGADAIDPHAGERGGRGWRQILITDAMEWLESMLGDALEAGEDE